MGTVQSFSACGQRPPYAHSTGPGHLRAEDGAATLVMMMKRLLVWKAFVHLQQSTQLLIVWFKERFNLFRQRRFSVENHFSSKGKIDNIK